MHFRQRDHLKRHLLKSHHEGTWWICNICQKKYFNSYELKRHLLRHDSVKSFVCSECEKCFCTSSDLKRHQSVHSVVKQFCCSLCGKDFKHKYTVKMHFRKCVQIQNTWFCGSFVFLVLYIFLWQRTSWCSVYCSYVYVNEWVCGETLIFSLSIVINIVSVRGRIMDSGNTLI